MLMCYAVIALLAVTGVSGVKPGFKARITQHALDYASQQAVDALAALVPKASIPDQSGSSGHMSYDLTSIRITGFTKPSGSIKLVPNKGLSWSAANAGLNLHADWRIKYRHHFIHFSTSGSVDAGISGVSFKTTLNIGVDSNGRPSIKSAGCSCTVGSVSIKIHGSIRLVLELFKDEVQKKVRAMIPGKLCDAVNGEINNNAESQLQKLKVVTTLAKKFQLDYRLVSAPSFQTAFMETFHKGEITWLTDPRPPPFSPPALPPYSSANNMLYLWIGEYVPQSFVYAAQQHGYLQYNLTTKDLPPDQRGFLNTTCTSVSCVGNLIPAIGKKYPGCTVELHMKSTTVPLVKMDPKRLEAKFAGDIAFYADTPQGKTPYLLTLNVSATFNMTATIADQLVVGNISGSSFQVGVMKSAVGQLNSKVINTMVGFAMKFFIIPKMNEQGNRGFPLPVTKDVQFVNTQLQIQQDALMIGTDLKYQLH